MEERIDRRLIEAKRRTEEYQTRCAPILTVLTNHMKLVVPSYRMVNGNMQVEYDETTIALQKRTQELIEDIAKEIRERPEGDMPWTRALRP